MQKRCTGLKDKTGRKIYEGDMYEYTLTFESNAGSFTKKYTEPVTFEDGEFYHGIDLLADVIEHDDTFTYAGDEE